MTGNYQAQQRSLTLAATGDALMTLRLAAVREPGFAAVVDRLRSADVRFTNLETVIRRNEGWPQAETGGATWIWSVPEVLADLRELGFELFGLAQNHMLDWGQEGLLACLKYMDAAGAVHAGAGRTLTEARRPAYLELPQRRVALIAVTSTFHEWNRAGEARSDCAGRPGINPLRIRSNLEVTDDEFRVLEGLTEQLHLQDVPQRVKSAMHPRRDGEVTFFGQRIRRGSQRQLLFEVDKGDADAVLAAVAEARRQADFVFVSLHSHEMAGVDPHATPDCLRTFSQQCIDGGADAVLGHGAHVVRGVEIYAGRPILHGLGNLFFQNETLPYQPAEFYDRSGLSQTALPGQGFDARTDSGRRGFPAKAIFWEGVIARCQWSDGKLTGLILDPLTLGHGLPRAIRGRPVIAEGAAGQAVIDRVAHLSERYGTTVVWDGEQCYGVVKLI